MDLNADLEWIHKELDNVKDPNFIQAIKNMLQYRKNVSQERISLEQYNIEIEESISQIDSNETYSHEQMGERIKKWAKK